MTPDDPAVVPDFWFRNMMGYAPLDPTVVAQVLSDMGIDRTAVEDGRRPVTQDDEAGLIDRLARATGNEFLGLEAGLAHYPWRGTILTYISRCCGTLGEVLQLTTRYVPITRPLTRAQLEPGPDGGAVVRFFNADPRLAVHIQHVEFAIGALVASFRKLTGNDHVPALIRMAHLRRTGHNSIAAMLNCPVEMNVTPTHEIHFTEAMLAQPLLTSDDALLAHLTSYADLLLEKRRRGQPSLRQRVEAAVLTRMANGVPTLADIAGDLSISERTLSRRLSECGLSYRQVVDELRRMLAETYLADLDLPLCEIAFLLGFADQSAFGAAFRRWTRQTPGQARAALSPRKTA